MPDTPPISIQHSEQHVSSPPKPAASSAPDADFLRPSGRSLSLSKNGAASALDLTDASISASEQLETGQYALQSSPELQCIGHYLAWPNSL